MPPDHPAPNDRPRVAVIYTHFPHYRAPVFASLSESTRYAFEFFYDPSGISGTIASGASASGHHTLKVRQFGPVMWQAGAISLALKSDFQAYVFLGNPFILSTWLAAPLVRLRRRRVYFWTHGWLCDERGAKAVLRNAFYRLADGLMLYSKRARDIGLRKGFAPDRLHVVNNSLDYAAQARARDAILSQDGADVGPDSAGAYFLAVGRLVKELELDLAIRAARRLQDDVGPVFSLVVVGDGPLRDSLEALAQEQGVDVRFLGAIYDEHELARYFVGARAVISPGKVGLLAIHALAYGTPVITHGDMDAQMPEVEVISPGSTGAFFVRHNAQDLAAKLRIFLARADDSPSDSAGPSRAAIRAEAIARIEADYTPQAQRQRIETALDHQLNGEQ